MDYRAEKMTEINNSLKRNEEANQLAIYRDSREVKLGITEKNPFSGQGGTCNSGQWIAGRSARL